MSYDYVRVVDQVLVESLHLRLVKSDEAFVIIGENKDVEKYKEVVNG